MNPETIRHLTLARRHAHQAVTALVPGSARAHLDAIAREARALLVDLLAEPAPAASDPGASARANHRIDIEE